MSVPTLKDLLTGQLSTTTVAQVIRDIDITLSQDQAEIKALQVLDTTWYSNINNVWYDAVR